MRSNNVKVTYMQLLLFFVLLFAFLPVGIIYSSGMASKIMQYVYVIQFILYSIVIVFCMRKRKDFDLVTKPVLCFLIWGIILIFVTFLESHDYYKLLRATVFVLEEVTLFLCAKYMFKYQRENIFSMLYIVFSLFAGVNFITVFLFPEGLYQSGWQGASYWFGGKFSTFYMFYTWLFFYSVKKRKSSILSFIFWGTIGILFCLKIDCSTGIACILFTGIMVMLRNVIIKIKPWILVCIVFGITILMISSSFLFDSKIVQYFITDVLNRNSMMTGRVEIYNDFWQIIQEKIFWGAGYDNTIITQNTSLGYLNAQNGVLDIFTKTGLIGVIIFGFTLYFFWEEVYYNIESKENSIAVVFLLGFLFCSFVEISFNTYFFLLLACSCGDLSRVSGKKGIVVSY